MYHSILIFMAVAFGFVYLMRRARVGIMLAFLAAGVVAGPHSLSLFSVDGAASETWSFLGMLGMAFLWFMLGLELNVRRIWRMRRMIFGFGAAQVAATLLIIAPALYIMTGWAALPVIMVAAMLTMSSTSGDLQLLAEKNELHSPAGRQSFAILLFQALLAIPLLAMLSVVDGNSLNLGGYIVDILVMTTAMVLGAAIVGRWVVNPIMRATSKLRSREAFILIILLNISLLSAVMVYFGLPAAIGAFIAGMLISESVYRHQVQADIAPYQTMFLAFFFIVLGMNLDVPLVQLNWYIVLAGVIGLILVKFAALFFVGNSRGISSRESFKIALLLSQGGEFGLLMLTTMIWAGINMIPIDAAQILMTIIALSMLTTPVLVRIYAWMEKRGWGFAAQRKAKKKDEDADDGLPAVKPAVVICGFGRVGQTIAKMFQTQHISYIALDMDADQVVMGRRENFNVFYGDSSREDVLRSLKIDGIKTCVLALDNLAIIKKTVRAMKSVSPRVKIYARSRNLTEADALVKQGVAVALPETIESSFVLGQEVMLRLGVPEAEIASMLENLRRDSYAELADILERNDPNYFKRNRKQIRELQHILLKGIAPGQKKTLADTLVAAPKSKK